MKKWVSIIFSTFLAWNLCNAQTNTRANWEQLEKSFSSTHLKEFYYKKGSLYNEAEGITNDYEISTALFFPISDSINKNLAFIFSIQSLVNFRKDGIIEESISYNYLGRQCYYRETEYIQGLYMDFENLNLSVCISFRKMAMHDQKFIENLLSELNIDSILETSFK